MADPHTHSGEQPFDGRRMVSGGFVPIMDA